MSPPSSRSSVPPRPLRTSLLDPDGLSPPRLGLYVGIGSMTMLFGASLIGYFVTRAQSKAWRSVDLPELPWSLWVSTFVLVGLSWSLHRAVKAIANNRLSGLSRHLFTALLLGLCFCAVQMENWRQVVRATLSVQAKGLYVYTFFMLTALHVLHVVAGLVPLWVTHRRSVEHMYSSSRYEGVRLVRLYWDFLLVVWVVLFGALSLS